VLSVLQTPSTLDFSKSHLFLFKTSLSLCSCTTYITPAAGCSCPSAYSLCLWWGCHAKLRFSDPCLQEVRVNLDSHDEFPFSGSQPETTSWQMYPNCLHKFCAVCTQTGGPVTPSGFRWEFFSGLKIQFSKKYWKVKLQPHSFLLVSFYKIKPLNLWIPKAYFHKSLKFKFSQHHSVLNRTLCLDFPKLKWSLSIWYPGTRVNGTSTSSYLQKPWY
jgi:hypothetical protein